MWMTFFAHAVDECIRNDCDVREKDPHRFKYLLSNENPEERDEKEDKKRDLACRFG